MHEIDPAGSSIDTACRAVPLRQLSLGSSTCRQVAPLHVECHIFNYRIFLTFLAYIYVFYNNSKSFWTAGKRSRLRPLADSKMSPSL